MKVPKQAEFARTAVVMATLILAACGGNSPTDNPPRPSYNVTLAASGGSGVTGTATIEDNAGSTSTVRIELVGMVANSSHAGHVHIGSCAQQGAIVTGLEVVTAGADGRGTATTTGVPDNLLSTEYYIQYHVAVNPPGNPLACGDLPQAPPPDLPPGY